MPITGISSDRICAIRLKVDDVDGPSLGCTCHVVTRALSTIYNTCWNWRVNHPCYFNAHLGWCRGGGDANTQGVIVNNMFGRCNLNAISLGSAAVGPCASGDTRSTIDYILAAIHQCRTLPFEDLNTSDHLPLIYVPVHKEDSHCAPPRID